MKKFSVLPALLICLMTLGLLLSCGDGACSEDSVGTCDSVGPCLDYLYLVTERDSLALNWRNDKSSFAVDEGVSLLVFGTNLNYAVNRFYITIRRENEIIIQREYNIRVPARIPQEEDEEYPHSFRLGFGTWEMEEAGDDYCVEVYVVDVMGNISNKMIRTFTVRQGPVRG
ncbi:MAG: hypothetical protein FWH19_04200 [Treponema sp.]|nr:hypothetical protein [Treponema sp.]